MRTKPRIGPAGWPATLIALVIGGALLLVGATVTPSQHGSPQAVSTAQTAFAQQTVLVGVQADALQTKAAQIRDALGFPHGVRDAVTHSHNNVSNADFDQVEDVDSQGHTISTIKFDPAGNLAAAVRLDTAPQPLAAVEQQQSIVAAQAAAAKLGLESDQPTQVERDPTNGGWRMLWARTDGGAPVRGDGTAIGVWPDGETASVTQTVHTLAALPATTLTREQALMQATKNLDQLVLSTKRDNYTPQQPTLEWVRPNGVLGGSRPLTGESIARLAWVVNVQTSGTVADYMPLLVLFLDAEDGSLLGGDMLM